MTLAQIKLRPPTRQRSRKVWTSDELEELWELAERLQGRPLPGVRLTEAEFAAEYGDEDIKAEWVDGEVIVMAPVSGEHSDLNFWLMRLMVEFVEHHDLGLVRGPEFPIRLAAIKRVRSPDVMFVGKTRFSKLHPTYFDGPPDVIMEIVSPDSEARDWRDKYADYQSTGVREYWVVDPLSKHVDAYTLGRSKKYSLIRPDDEGRIHSKVLKGLFVDPQWLWRSPLPKLSGVLKELKLR
jgi:Uma2 family endonuclease